MSDESNEKETKWYFSRRRMMRDAGLAAGGLAAGGVLGFTIASLQEEDMEEFEPAPKAADVTEDAFEFLTLDQAEAVERLIDRIYPEDENGPGAVELGVLFFIDGQLAGAWGEGAKHYTEPPYHPEEAVPEQGWQYRHTPNEVYELALNYLETHTQNAYGKAVGDLSDEEADEVVAALESDDVDAFRGFTPSSFFSLLRQNTLEGVYSDPMYSGNRGMMGWRMKDYPGTPMSLLSYKDRITDDQFYDIDPVSLSENAATHGDLNSTRVGGESHGHGGDGDG